MEEGAPPRHDHHRHDGHPDDGASRVTHAAVPAAHRVGDAPHLVLHFDVNKTLVMLDPAGGKVSLDDMLNDLLSEIAYGTVTQGEWKVASLQLGSTVAPPTGVQIPEGLPLINYYDFILNKHPDDKALRTTIRIKFTLPGEPGERLRPHFDALKRAMQTEEWREDESGADSTPQYHYLIPSFLYMLKHLKESGRSFTLVFRTFGQDLPHVTEHFDHFCEGRHPLFPGFVMDGSDGKPDYRISTKKSQHGAFYRHGKDKHESHLVMGSWDQVPSNGAADWRHHYADDAKVLSGFDAIYDFIYGAGTCTLAFRDYFPWWRDNKDAAYAGKLFILDPNEARVHSIFFDDNIYLNGSQPEWMNIVDIRDKATGSMLQHSEYVDRHLVKVEPAEVILDQRYYVRTLERAIELGPLTS